MSPIRIGPSLPPIAEAAPEAAKPHSSVESAAQTASASSREEQFIQPSPEDEVLIAFENGEQRMAYLIGTLWNEDTPPTTASPSTDGTSGETQPSCEPATEKHEMLTDAAAKTISEHRKTRR